MPWITKDDFIEVGSKLHQRGWRFLLSKFTLNEKARTLSAFDTTEVEAANWWIVPKVRARWNTLVSGDENTTYEQFLANTLWKDRKNMRMLSLGSGVCSHELAFASGTQWASIHCVDIANNLLKTAQEKADALGYTHFSTEQADVWKIELQKNHYDVILFHSSLHHFTNIEALLTEKVLPALCPGGVVVINEYVGPNRNQIPKEQVAAVRKALSILPERLRKRLGTGRTKNSFSGPGALRMWVADPSECVESALILPILRKLCTPIIEKPLGGNILIWVLKDIAHHFLDNSDKEAQSYLQQLMEIEDTYLAQGHQSEIYFGVYQKK